MKCIIPGCKKKAKYKNKTLCFKHLTHRETVEITMPFEIKITKKRTRRKKEELG